MPQPSRTDIAAACEIHDALYQCRVATPDITVACEIQDVLNQWRLATPNTATLVFGHRHFLSTAASTYPRIRADALLVDLSAAVLPISFANVTTYVEPPAAVFLARLPWHVVHPILTAISQWVPTAPVSAARVCLISQSVDDETWDEVVVELRLDCDTDTALSLWDQLSHHLDAIRLTFAPPDREIIDRNISIHFNWGDDPQL